jgi:MFS family permease
VITITLLVAAVCTPVSGKLGDMYGKRRVGLVLLALLIAGSVTAAMAATVVPLIVGRGLQGTGLGVIPLGIAILRDSVPRVRLASATALVSATLGVEGAIGLPVSAFVTEYFDWHLLFWIAAGIGVVSFVLYFVFVPASAIRSGGRFDYVGAVGLGPGSAPAGRLERQRVGVAVRPDARLPCRRRRVPAGVGLV